MSSKNSYSDIGHGKGEIVVYQTHDGQVKLDVRLERETLWMTQSDMAQLFQCSADNISLHLKNIFEEGELDSVSTTEDFSVVRQEGVRQVARKLPQLRGSGQANILKSNRLF